MRRSGLHCPRRLFPTPPYLPASMQSYLPPSLAVACSSRRIRIPAFSRSDHPVVNQRLGRRVWASLSYIPVPRDVNASLRLAAPAIHGLPRHYCIPAGQKKPRIQGERVRGLTCPGPLWSGTVPPREVERDRTIIQPSTSSIDQAVSSQFRRLCFARSFPQEQWSYCGSAALRLLNALRPSCRRRQHPRAAARQDSPRRSSFAARPHSLAPALLRGLQTPAHRGPA